jgi:hypothetical protein
MPSTDSTTSPGCSTAAAGAVASTSLIMTPVMSSLSSMPKLARSAGLSKNCRPVPSRGKPVYLPEQLPEVAAVVQCDDRVSSSGGSSRRNSSASASGCSSRSSQLACYDTDTIVCDVACYSLNEASQLLDSAVSTLTSVSDVRAGLHKTHAI